MTTRSLEPPRTSSRCRKANIWSGLGQRLDFGATGDCHLYSHRVAPHDGPAQPQRVGRGAVGVGDVRRDVPPDRRLRHLQRSRRAHRRVQSAGNGARAKTMAQERARLARRRRTRVGGAAEALAEQGHVPEPVGHQRGGAHRERGRVQADGGARTRRGAGSHLSRR